MHNQTQVPKHIEKLTQWRDELKLQAHLFNAEAKEQWKQLEKDWELLESEVKRIAPVARRAVADTAKATTPLMRKIETSLTKNSGRN